MCFVVVFVWPGIIFLSSAPNFNLLFLSVTVYSGLKNYLDMHLDIIDNKKYGD